MLGIGAPRVTVNDDGKTLSVFKGNLLTGKGETETYNYTVDVIRTSKFSKISGYNGYEDSVKRDSLKLKKK